MGEVSTLPRDHLVVSSSFVVNVIAEFRLRHQRLLSDEHSVVPFGQGFYSMASPAAQFERLVIAGKIEHGGHPILRWMASNVTVEQDSAGNIKPSKKKSNERIDGIVAAIMALGRAMATPPHKPSVYETRGLLVI